MTRPEMYLPDDYEDFDPADPTLHDVWSYPEQGDKPMQVTTVWELLHRSLPYGRKG